MDVVSTPETVNFYEEKYNDCTIRYGDMKKQLAEDMIVFIKPLSEKIKAIAGDDAYLKKVMQQGKEKAHASASKTMKEVREIIGINY